MVHYGGLQPQGHPWIHRAELRSLLLHPPHLQSTWKRRLLEGYSYRNYVRGFPKMKVLNNRWFAMDNPHENERFGRIPISGNLHMSCCCI